MMIRRLMLTAALTCAVTLTGTSVALAAKVPAPAIAVVDVQMILRDSTAAAGIRDQMEKHQTSFQNEISQQENALRTADQDLSQKKAVLSAEAYQAQVQEFQKKVATLGELVQKRKKQLDEAYGKSMKQVQDTLMDIVQQQMKESGANIVLPRTAVVDMSKEMDITQETLKRLNQKLPSVKVVVPAQ